MQKTIFTMIPAWFCRKSVQCLYQRTSYHSTVFNQNTSLKMLCRIFHIASVPVRNISNAGQNEELDGTMCNRSKKTFTKSKSNRNLVERGSKMKEMSDLVQALYRAQKFKKPDLSEAKTLIADIQRPSKINSLHFQRAYVTIQDPGLESRGQIQTQKIVNEFRRTCEQLDNQELLALLFHVAQKNKTKVYDLWPQNIKSLTILLDREISRRLYSCLQLNGSLTKETLTFFQTVLQVMLAHNVGVHYIRAYITYCTYRFDSVANMETVPLLFLAIIKVYSSPGHLFLRLEEFTLEHLDKFDVKLIGLMCLSFFVGDTDSPSLQLLDQIAIKLIQELKHERPVKSNDLVNILKLFCHHGYLKPSFYHDLEGALSANFIDSCNVASIMHILDTYMTFKIYPSDLIERLVRRCKALLDTPDKQKRPRRKDIGRLLRSLGNFQYEDFTTPDIYTLCAECLQQEIDVSRYTSTHIAMNLTDSLMGMVYVRKFNSDIIDDVFGIQNLATLLKGLKDEDLLLLHHTIRLEYPEYTGRTLDQGTIDSLQERVDKKWTIESELDWRYQLLDILRMLQSLLGEDKVLCGYILPHIKIADIELFINEDNELVEPKFAKTRLAVEVIGQMQCVRGTDKVLGRYAVKLRQLKLLGYRTILVYPSEQESVLKYGSTEEKTKFWIRKLEESGVKLHPEIMRTSL